MIADDSEIFRHAMRSAVKHLFQKTGLGQHIAHQKVQADPCQRGPEIFGRYGL